MSTGTVYKGDKSSLNRRTRTILVGLGVALMVTGVISFVIAAMPTDKIVQSAYPWFLGVGFAGSITGICLIVGLTGSTCGVCGRLFEKGDPIVCMVKESPEQLSIMHRVCVNDEDIDKYTSRIV